jgi:hypothetical protein
MEDSTKVRYDDTKVRYEEEIKQWQRDTFPQDPVLLYQLRVVDKSGEVNYYYAIPKEDMLNPDFSFSIIFFDIIEQDRVVERAFVGYSIMITKVVFNTVEDLFASPNAPAVFDMEHNAPRASKVLLGLLGGLKQ